MNTMNMPGFAAEHSLYKTNRHFHITLSDTFFEFNAEIRPQLNCIEQDGHVVCTDGGGFGLGYTDVPLGFPGLPFDHRYAQCRATI